MQRLIILVTVLIFCINSGINTARINRKFCDTEKAILFVHSEEHIKSYLKNRNEWIEQNSEDILKEVFSVALLVPILSDFSDKKEIIKKVKLFIVEILGIVLTILVRYKKRIILS